jgi:hypothetical protein
MVETVETGRLAATWRGRVRGPAQCTVTWIQKVGWPLSGVVYFNILRIYIITGFVQCKSVGALSRDVLVYIIHNLLYAVFKT